jgi:hypothetical protein
LIAAGFWESLPEQLRTALIGVCVVALVGIGRILYVWLRRIEQQIGEVKVTAKATEFAVNHQPEGTPPIAVQVTRIAEGLEVVAAEADRKHEENQAVISGVAADVARMNARLDTISRALGMDVAPWDPSQGDRRHQ